MNTLKALRVPIIIFVVFWSIAFVLWQTSGKAFYLLNFGYIGTAIGFGIGLYVLLPRKRKPTGIPLVLVLTLPLQIFSLIIFKITTLPSEKVLSQPIPLHHF